MTRAGPITDDPTPSDNWPAAVWPGGRPTAVPVRRQTIGPMSIGPKPIVVVDREPVVSDAERDAVGRFASGVAGDG